MGSSAKKIGATVDTSVIRSAVWEHVASGELAFDFSPQPVPAKPAIPEWSAQNKGSVKDAIIRFLEEQL